MIGETNLAGRSAGRQSTWRHVLHNLHYPVWLLAVTGSLMTCRTLMWLTVRRSTSFNHFQRLVVIDLPDAQSVQQDVPIAVGFLLRPLSDNPLYYLDYGLLLGHLTDLPNLAAVPQWTSRNASSRLHRLDDVVFMTTPDNRPPMVGILLASRDAASTDCSIPVGRNFLISSRTAGGPPF